MKDKTPWIIAGTIAVACLLIRQYPFTGLILLCRWLPFILVGCLASSFPTKRPTLAGFLAALSLSVILFTLAPPSFQPRAANSLNATYLLGPFHNALVILYSLFLSGICGALGATAFTYLYRWWSSLLFALCLMPLCLFFNS